MVTAPLGKLYDGIAERSRRLHVGLLGDQVQSSTGVAFLRCEMQRSEPVGVTGIQGDAELDELLGEDRVPALGAQVQGAVASRVHFVEVPAEASGEAKEVEAARKAAAEEQALAMAAEQELKHLVLSEISVIAAEAYADAQAAAAEEAESIAGLGDKCAGASTPTAAAFREAAHMLAQALKRAGSQQYE